MKKEKANWILNDVSLTLKLNEDTMKIKEIKKLVIIGLLLVISTIIAFTFNIVLLIFGGYELIINDFNILLTEVFGFSFIQLFLIAVFMQFTKWILERSFIQSALKYYDKFKT